MHLVLDFDGTMTEHDTIGELARAALALQRRRGGDDGLEAAWLGAVRAYGADVDAHRRAQRPGEAERRSVADEVRHLAGLRRVEEASLDRVGRTGVLAGLDAGQLFAMGADAAAAGRVVLRPGLAAVAGLAARRGWRVDVVSVHWSAAFIHGVVHPLRLPVTANDVAADGRIRGPGGALGPGRLTTSLDKARAARHLIEAHGRGGDGRTLYFGDSVTDLECLLLGGGGVVMADGRGSALLQTLERIGVGVCHVGERRRDEGGVAWARDFNEVLASGLLG